MNPILAGALVYIGAFVLVPIVLMMLEKESDND